MVQILINSIISGLILALVALGFHIIFTTTKIFHIAHGGIYILGAYFFNWLNPIIGFVPGLICTLLFSFLMGVFIEWIIYKPLKTKSNNQNIALISSLGIYLVLVNLVAMLFGNETKLFDSSFSNSYMISNIIITRPQFFQIIVAVPIIIFFIAFLKLTGYGLKIRAVSNNPVLAGVVGINVQRIRYLVFGIGSVLVVIAALLKAYDTGLDPYSGMAITLSAAVIVIVGGNSSIFGTLIASITLAVIQNYTEYFLSAQWKEPVTFGILIIMLLWRTEGILQFNNRSDEK